MPQPDYDVVLAGYGPVSEILALALGRRGHRVAVFERWRERYPLPRAVCIDHEMYRMLCALGMRDALPAVSHSGPWYRWYNAEWKELLAIDWSSESVSGGPEVNFVHQPTLEDTFDAAVRACPSVDLHLGCEVLQVRDAGGHAEAAVRDTQSGATRTVRAKFIVGADGANSLVRQAIGSTQEDRGFEADWLVIDVLPHEGVTLDVPSAAQYCNPERPTTIVPAGVKDGRFFRRWEFMRLPHETRADLEDEGVAWKLLAPWVTPQQASIVRHKVYTFRSLLADRWRSGRLLIAGDAAHVMPPFMGQGMCAGLRDDWNLAWKLDLVLRGQADARLLDTYQPERRPHVSDVIDLSMFLGRIICIADPAQAAERDAMFLSKDAPPPPPFPQLTAGILQRDADGALRGPAGLLCPHGHVRQGDREGRFDDVAGLGFVLLSRVPLAGLHLGARQQSLLAQLQARQVHMVPAGTGEAADAAEDLHAKYLPFLDAHGVDVLLVRPDFYVYGGAQAADAAALVDSLAQDLRSHGLHAAAAPQPAGRVPAAA